MGVFATFWLCLMAFVALINERRRSRAAGQIWHKHREMLAHRSLARARQFVTDPSSGLTTRAGAILIRITTNDGALDRGTPSDDDGYRRKVLRSSVLPLLFLVLALPIVLIQVYLTPPMQVADEENHFLRALQISSGQFLAHKIGSGNAGGSLDPAAPVFAHDFDALKFEPEVKVDLEAYAAASLLRWKSGPAVATAFPNTAIYPFFLYLPASGGLAVGRALDLSVLDSFYLARLSTALASTAIAALALAICGRGRTMLFVLLCFPMTLSLFASVSQDAMAIALGALAAAAWAGSVTRGLAMPAAVRAAVALALGAVAAARIPLFPLYVLAVMPTRFPAKAPSRPGLVDLAAGAVGVVPLAIGLYGAHAAKVAFRERDGVSPTAQLSWLVLHPIEAVAVAVRTLDQDTLPHLHELVGVLGWLDTNLPKGFYTWMGLCVVMALLIDAGSPSRGLPRVCRLLPPAAVVMSAAGVFGAFYLAWTPVGAPVVDGVQGRYFIVPAIVLAVSLSGFRQIQAYRIFGLEAMQILFCGSVAVVDLWVVPITILHRYYG